MSAARPRRPRRALLWAALVALLLVAQSTLVVLTLGYENSRAQEQVEQQAAEMAARAKQIAGRDLQSLQALLWLEPGEARWRAAADELLQRAPSLLRIEQRDSRQVVGLFADSPFGTPLFRHIGRAELQLETELACAAALRHGGYQHSRSYFVPTSDGEGVEVVDLCLPRQSAGAPTAYLVASLGLHALLEEAGDKALAGNEISFVEGDGTRLARAGLVRGAGLYTAERVVDLPGLTLQLRVDSAAGRPQLIPNLATALVLGLSLALFAVVLLLARDVRKRAAAERALADALAFRQAMENSLSTGLRARDLSGNITYVNNAFCAMVGYSEARLLGVAQPPYWPPEFA
ncbi:MAG TPA: PAS domain S-box protein, partial [Burkholderiaceae bacterium]